MSSVSLLHVHRTEARTVAKALDQALVEWKYKRSEIKPVPIGGPGTLEPVLDRGVGYLCYLLSPERGNWTTLIQAFEERDDAPFLADLSNRLSEQLQTHCLAVLLHEDDVLYYNLDYRGTPRDGYNSNPQMLADHVLSDAEVLQHRHMPKAFTPLLPKHIKMEKLVDLLNAGWWQAYDAKELDETGDLIHEHAMVDEEDRLNTLGGLLQLNGSAGYPFTNWSTTTHIDWKQYTAIYYQAKGRALTMAT